MTADTVPSSSSSALLAQQGLITPLLKAEKRSVFITVTVFVRVCSHLVVFVSQHWGKRKTETLLVISSAVSLSGPGSFLRLRPWKFSWTSWGRSPGCLPLGWLGFFEGKGWEEGCGRKRDVHTGRDGVFSAASAVSAGRNPSHSLMQKGTMD